MNTKPPQVLCPHCGHDQKRCAWSPSGKERELLNRTLKIIERGGVILLKRKDGWYLGQWTNIAAGPDKADWSKRKNALEMFNLKWALTIAPLYGCEVVVRYPKT